MNHATRGVGRLRPLLRRYRREEGGGFRLKDYDPGDLATRLGHTDAEQLLADGVARLSELQTRLYAQHQWSLLLILQGMDSAGKDSTIKHVMSGVNPQGVQVTSFKTPGPDELAHDFLWRVHRAVPTRGHIGIFNRSHYEEVLICRVHPELLKPEGLPDEVMRHKFWRHRLEDIAAFERYLTHQGVVVVKVFLHISKDEQKRRFLSRLETPRKHWKFSAHDLTERDYWDAYQDAYERAIAATATPYAPWYIVPADHKPLAHVIVVEALIRALERLELHIPELPAEERKLLAAARHKLESE
jgi:PPK2 family polyphosphate:nucleotide phosphotransferase